MSRVSLARRMMALLERAERHDRQAVRLFRMTPAVRAEYDRWVRLCEAEAEGYPPDGSLYAAFLSGAYVPPPPPRAVCEALELAPAPRIPSDATADESAAIYSALLALDD